MTAIDVYIAHPLDQAKGRPFMTEVEEVVYWLGDQEDVGWIYQPGSAFRVGNGSKSAGLQQINNEALNRSSLVVAWLPAGIPSIGTPIEIERALQAGIPTVVVSDAPSWVLRSLEGPLKILPHVTSFGRETLQWARETRKGISEGLGVSPRASLPVRVSEGSEAPKRGFHDDAGLDLIVSESTTLEPGEFTDVPCGIEIELPGWSWGMITGRSSTLRNRGLLVNQGIIDAGYRGPIFAGAWNLTEKPVTVWKGERIAQLLVMVNGTRNIEVTEVNALRPGSRGDAGFGSTGK